MRYNRKVAGCLVLLVEDDPADAAFTIDVFRRSTDCQIEHVADGEEALDFLFHRGKYSAARRPDLVLLDMNLPKRNGFEVLAEIRAHEDLRYLPVVVLTISAYERDLELAYALGANFYMVKPTAAGDIEQALTLLRDLWLKFVKAPRFSGKKGPQLLADFRSTVPPLARQ
jgi:two-component system response regulator